MTSIMKIIAGVMRTVRLMASRGLVTLVDASPGMQTVQVQALANELRSTVEHPQEYGFVSKAKPPTNGVGAEAFVVSIVGARDHLVAVVVGDRRYTLRNLADGEVALYDDLGQWVKLKRGGVEVKSLGTLDAEATGAVTITGASITLEGPVETTAEIVAGGDVTDGSGGLTPSMADMRAAFNAHRHSNPEGGFTGLPTAAM